MRLLCYIIVVSFAMSCKREKMIGFRLEFSKIGTIIYQDNEELYYLDYKIGKEQVFLSSDELSCDTIKMSLTSYEMEKINNAFLENKIYLFNHNNNDVGDIIDEIHTDENLKKYTIITDRRKIVVNYQNSSQMSLINRDKTNRFKLFHSVLDIIYSEKIKNHFKNR